jgi:hypothetical protein
MNYIRHLTAFYNKLCSDNRLTPSHVCLYFALFQYWNLNHFNNPFSIARTQILQLSKIGSNHTYYNALKDLCNWGYIEYGPSSSPNKGSQIIMCIFAPIMSEKESFFEQERCKNDIGIGAKMHPKRCKISIAGGAKMHPSINNININNKTFSSEQSQNEIQILNSENMKTENQELFATENIKRKKVAQKKEKAMQHPLLNEVITFFLSENFPEIEAKKYFNHFESNGWRVGGKSPMKNWNAAARNWMLNSQKFITPQNFPKSQQKPNSKPDPNNKNYAEPL